MGNCTRRTARSITCLWLQGGTPVLAGGAPVLAECTLSSPLPLSIPSPFQGKDLGPESGKVTGTRDWGTLLPRWWPNWKHYIPHPSDAGGKKWGPKIQCLSLKFYNGPPKSLGDNYSSLFLLLPVNVPVNAFGPNSRDSSDNKHDIHDSGFRGGGGGGGGRKGCTPPNKIPLLACSFQKNWSNSSLAPRLGAGALW